MNLAPLSSARSGSPSYLPYLCIALVSFVSHGLLLTNDGAVWDSWYLLNFLQTRNWPTMFEFFGAVGIPLYGWLYAPFAWLPGIVAGFMLATFLCLFVNAVLVYRLAMQLGRLTQGESLALAILAQSVPVFSAGQDFSMLFFIFAQMLFLAASLLATSMLVACGPRQHLLRGLSIAAFYVSFTNSALLVFYGSFYLLLFLRSLREGESACIAAFRGFLGRYPEFLLLPPAAWAARPFLTPQHGWYAHYNSPAANLPELWPNFASFFENVIPYHIRQTAAWPIDYPVAAVALAIVAIFLYRQGVGRWPVARSPVATVHLAWFGALALLLAVFPYAAAGKEFSPAPLGESSRHAMLAVLPLAILCLAFLRPLFVARSGDSRWLLPILACLTTVFSTQTWPVYLSERVQWIYSRALLHQAVKNEVVRASSVVLLQGYSVVRQDAYGIFGFASAFGDLSRLVTAQAPQNRQYFTPAEIEQLLLYTTLLPGNFRRIDPAGQQVVLVTQRLQTNHSDWELALRYFVLRHFGASAELEAMFESLVTLSTHILKPATALVASVATIPRPSQAADFAAREFVNGAGMPMVKLPQGWWAGKFETTQAQYLAVTGANPSLFVDDARPVDSVSWHEAVQFCDRLSASEARSKRLPPGNVYRLPTSREFALMAVESPLGNSVISTREVRWHSEPVGSLPPNALGLHDVVGNVWEWSLDWGDRSRRVKASNGGSWVDHAASLTWQPGLADYFDPSVGRARGSVRKDYPDQGFWNRGFRCVLARPVEEV